MDLKAALAEFSAQAHADQQGKTYRQFWDWFSDQEKVLLAQASPEEREWLEEQLLELTADCDDAGLAVPPEMIDRVIGQE